jgi:hypothetical protein
MEGVSLVESLDDEVGKLHGFSTFRLPFAREKDHLIGESRNSLHPTSHRAGE